MAMDIGLGAWGTSQANKQAKAGAGGIADVANLMYERGKMTPEEQTQYLGSFDIGRILNEIAKYRQGVGAMPSGYLSPEAQYQQGGALAQGLYGQTLKDVQDPYASFESTLQPQLQVAEDYINRGAQSRGLLRSGIPIEAMGRAGVELAIQEANNRMNWRQQALSNAMNLSQYSNQLGQQNYSNLQNQYNAQQGYGLSAMARQAGQAQAAGGYSAQPYQIQLGAAYGRGAGQNAGLVGLQQGYEAAKQAALALVGMGGGQNMGGGGYSQYGNLYGSNTPYGVRDRGIYSSLGSR